MNNFTWADKFMLKKICSAIERLLTHALVISKPVLTRVTLYFLIIAMNGSVFSVQAQTLDKHKLTASYLYNFARNIEWPNEGAMTSFNIGVYGADNAQLMTELLLLADNVKLRNLPITVSQVNSVRSLANLHLIYVEQANNALISDIYDALGGKPILLVTLESTYKQLVMINLVASGTDRLRFEVNNSNIINHGLKPLPELILNGGTEIDVARLFREGQASLIELQKQLQAREATLNDLSAAVVDQEAANARLEQQLTELTRNIQQSDTLITEQKNQLNMQREEIEKSKEERLALLHEMELRTRELDKQQQQLTAISQKIDVREKRLAELNLTIRRQENELITQQEAIVGLDELVNSQKTALRYLWWSVVLGILLIVTIFIAYAIKRRDNQRLAAHSQDLQIAKDRLAIAKRKAEDASQAKSDFLSLMSHELRTPLQAIIGYTEVVIEELSLYDDQRHISDLTRVISNSERLLKLINGVLDLAKIESGRMQLDLTEVKLSSLVDEALGTIGPLFDKNSIRLSVEVEDGPFLPLADPEKLLHVLINLLGNASKYAPSSFVTIKAFHEPKRIYISVADTGIGLTPDQQLQIFEPFRQADNGTTRKFQGSGLGLSITRQLCEMMGGTISVKSQLGAGATFIVEVPLPIVPIPEPDASSVVSNISNSVSSTPNSSGQHIVMIANDRDFLEVASHSMNTEGYHVHTAADVETGFSLVQAVNPQVITLDLLLPQQDAWLVFERIKADPELQTIPIILIAITEQSREDLTMTVGAETLRLAVQKLVRNKD